MSGQIDLVLMDVYTLGGESGLEAAAKIKVSYPNIRIVIVTSMPEESFIRKARAAGCESFWYKDVGDTEILDVMNRTMAGESIYPDSTPPVKIGLASSTEFTPKEMEVLRLFASYKNYRELAEKLGISERTVRYHIGNLLEKTGYETPMQLAFEVAQKGLIVTFKREL
jgi:DNA-binding NarL/FixJ family response regulator